MDDPPNDYESVRWERPETDGAEDHSEVEARGSTLPQRPKANAKERRQDSHSGTQPDHTADKVDLAGITSEGFLVCTVEKPQKESEGTKEAYVSYAISTHVSWVRQELCWYLTNPSLPVRLQDIRKGQILGPAEIHRLSISVQSSLPPVSSSCSPPAPRQAQSRVYQG